MHVQPDGVSIVGSVELVLRVLASVPGQQSAVKVVFAATWAPDCFWLACERTYLFEYSHR